MIKGFWRIKAEISSLVALHLLLVSLHRFSCSTRPKTPLFPFIILRQMEADTHKFRVVVLGDSKVGKTTLIQQVTRLHYDPLWTNVRFSISWIDG